MWKSIATWTIKNRLFILIFIVASTVLMGYFASKVQLSYEFTNAIPTTNPKLQQYKDFKKIFGEDGNLMVIGFQKEAIFQKDFFSTYKEYCVNLKKIEGIENVLSVPTAVNITKIKTDTSEKLSSHAIFANIATTDSGFATQAKEFLNLPFYKNLLYNTETNTQLIAVRINKDILKSSKRVEVVNNIKNLSEAFGTANKVEMKYSGLPLIRSLLAVQVQKELRLFLIISLVFTAIILFVFFRSFSSVLFSLLIVLSGVVWSLGILYLLGFKLTLLTGLIPPLMVVIGIPNCIYFLNKYHQEYAIHSNQAKALVRMVQRMGIVTLFTNLTAAIGFGVFCFTASTILKEFGWVAWLSIIVIFFISLFALTAIFSYMPPPNVKHTNYLENKTLQRLLDLFESWIFKHRPTLYISWGVVLLIAVVGLFKLHSVGYMVDDLPKKEKIYTDLKFFEKNFKGVMPLEIWIDTKHKNGATSLSTMQKIDELSAEITKMPNLGRPLSIVEAVKFARQAYYNSDSTSYAVPSSFDAAFLAPYLRMKGTNNANSQLNELIKAYVDSTKQHTRVSINMADVGSVELPKILQNIQSKASDIFDTSRYNISYTGTSIVFLEGSKFIINSLRDSIFYAFLMIFACMIFLFRSWRVVLISICANIIPLIITAGIMGWFGIPLKPSTVLVFSVALGITVDVTIRFLVNFKQELPKYNNNIKDAVRATLHDTGLSIIYTSIILVAGFLVFVVSTFDGTKALGYLTSITLLLAMLINLTVLPALLVWMDKVILKKATNDPLWEVMNEEEDIDLDKLTL